MPLAPLLQDTPNTANFLYIGFSIMLGLLALYVASLSFRRRNLQKDLDLIESLKADEAERQPPAP